MESDNIQDDRGICADVPLTDANVLRDRDINSAAVAAGQGKTSAKLVAGVYACPLDGKGAESKTESSVACPDDGVQLHEEYMAETIALLSDAVRTQLSLADSKEEESATDATGFEDINAEKSPDDGGEDGKATKSDNDGNNSGTLQVSSTLTDDTKSEPFPDYYESCEKNPQLIDKEREEAYNYAISKVVEEVIRFREVDASITDLPSPDSQIFGMTDYISGGQGAGSSGGNTPAEEWRPASRSEIHRVASFNDMTRILSRSDLKPNLRQRFIGITNMVVRMEHLLFRQHRSMPDDLILTNRDLWELNVMATETVRYLSILGNKLQDLVDDAYRVAFILNEISKDKVSSLTRYQRMAQVVMEYLRKPRSLERRLLCAFLDFYDSHIYTKFLQLYNRHIVREIYAPEAMFQLSRLLVGLWDVLNRAIENYELYVNMLVDMRENYFRPVVDELGRCPDIWQESYDR